MLCPDNARPSCKTATVALSGINSMASLHVTLEPLSVYTLSAIDDSGKHVTGALSTGASGEIQELDNISGSLCFEFFDDSGLSLINSDAMTRTVSARACRIL